MKKQMILLINILVISNTITPNYFTDVIKYTLPAAKSIFISQAENRYDAFLTNNSGLKEFLLDNGTLTGLVLLAGGVVGWAYGQSELKHKYIKLTKKNSINSGDIFSGLSGFFALAGLIHLSAARNCDFYFTFDADTRTKLKAAEYLAWLAKWLITPDKQCR